MQGLLFNMFTPILTLKATVQAKAIRILFVVGMGLLLTACTNENSNSGSVPEAAEPIGKINGMAYIGLVESGTVKIYAFDGIDRGTALKTISITLDEQTAEGRYTTSMQTPSKSIMVCLSGAKYREITKQDLINFKPDQELCAVDNYISSNDGKMTINLTYYSHIATGLAKRLISLGLKPVDAISKANQEIENWVTYNVNTVTPVNLSIIPTSPTAVLLPKHRAGFANAAISVYSGWVNGISGIGPTSPDRLTKFNSILFAQRAHDDIASDGVLDGKSDTGPTGLGAVILSTNTYRHDIALDMLVMANNKNNKSGINLKSSFKDTLFVDAARYSRYDVPNSGITSVYNIFGNTRGNALQNQKPTMNNFIIPKLLVNDDQGGVKFAASLTDTINQIVSIEYNIINNTINASVPFKTYLSTDLGLDGKPIDLSRTTARLANPKDASGVYQYEDGTNYSLNIVASYTVIGDPTNTIKKIIKPAQLTFGNVGTQLKGLNPITTSFVSGTFNLFSGISNPNGVDSVELTIDGQIANTTVSNFNPGSKYNVPIFRVNTLTENAGAPLEDRAYTFVITAKNDVGVNAGATNQIITKKATYTIDNTPPTVSVNPPIIPASLWFTSSFNVDVTPGDGTGSGVSNYKILLDGQAVVVESTLVTGTTNPHNIVVANVPDGVHSLSVQVTDKVGQTFTSTPIPNINTDNRPPSLTITPISQSSTYTLPASTCMLNTILAKDATSGVASIVIDSVPSSAPITITAPTAAVNVNLGSLIPTGTVIPAINFSIKATDVAGLTTTKSGTIEVIANTLVANSFTCAVVITP